jgi:hypothetical protein
LVDLAAGFFAAGFDLVAGFLAGFAACFLAKAAAAF